MNPIYKYFPPHIFTLVCRTEILMLKATCPRDFNDPFELFLTPDLSGGAVEADTLAFYQDIIGEIPQRPTVCFSKLPDVVPMWAHYALDSSGFVIEFDEDRFRSHAREIVIEDITYSSSPATVSIAELGHAQMTMKPRHTYFIQSRALNSAYFTKGDHWKYEAERRIVLADEMVTEENGVRLWRVPHDCMSKILLGVRAKPALKAEAEKFGAMVNVPVLSMMLGRSSMQPYFFDADKKPHIFLGGQLVPAEHYCAECGEPIANEELDTCGWCQIRDAHREQAAFQNPMRRLAAYGMLEEYYRKVEAIGRGKAH